MPSLSFRLGLFCLSVLGCYLPLMMRLDDDHYSDSTLQSVLSLSDVSVNQYMLLVATFSGCVSIAALRFCDMFINLNEMNVIMEFYERLLIIVTTMLMGCLLVSNDEVSSTFCQLFICSMACQRVCWSTSVLSLLNYYIVSEFDDATAFLLNIWLTVPEVLSCFVSGKSNMAGIAVMMMRFSGVGVLLFSLLRWTWRKLEAYSPLDLSFLVLALLYEDEDLMALTHLFTYTCTLLVQFGVLYGRAHPGGWADLSATDLAVYAGSLVVSNVLMMLCSARIIRHYTVELRTQVLTKRDYECAVAEKMRAPLEVVSTVLQVLAEEQKAQGPGVGKAFGFGGGGDSVQMEAEIGACNEISRLVDSFVEDVPWMDAFSTANVLRDIVDLGSFVEASVEPFVAAAQAKHITFSTLNAIQDSRDKFVKVDGVKLNQVMRDVLTNALQYTREGGFITVSAHVHTHTRPARCTGRPQEQEFVSIKVKDSGVGVLKRLLPNLLAERVRIRGNQLVEFPPEEPNDGCAMSLSVGRQVLEEHGGWLVVDSGGIGQGTVVTLTLPTVPDEHPGDAALFSTSDRYATSSSSAYYEALTTSGGASIGKGREAPARVPPRSKMASSLGGPKDGPTPTPIGKPAPASGNAAKAPWRPSRLERIVSAVELYPAEEGSAPADTRVRANEDSGDGRRRRFGEALHVLIVDESAMSSKILGRLVKLLGHTHETAADGQACLDMVEVANGRGGGGKDLTRFDAILIDYRLPLVSGPQVAHILRNVLNFRGVIVGVTGDAAPNIVSNFIERGAQQILIKPVSVDQLKGALRSCVALCEEKFGEYASDNEDLDSFTDKDAKK